MQHKNKELQELARDASAVMGPKVIQAYAEGSRHAAELVAAWKPSQQRSVGQ